MILPCTFGERKDKTHLWFPRERLVKEKTHLWFPSVRLVKEKKILIDGSPVHVWWMERRLRKNFRPPDGLLFCSRKQKVVIDERKIGLNVPALLRRPFFFFFFFFFFTVGEGGLNRSFQELSHSSDKKNIGWREDKYSLLTYATLRLVQALFARVCVCTCVRTCAVSYTHLTLPTMAVV